MKAQIISIGTELTTGQSVDTNSAWLSQRLAEMGISVEAHATIADDLEGIRAGIERAGRAADLVLVSGGLGPTEDDLTRQALAAAMGVELELRDDFFEYIKAIFADRGMSMPETNRVQAMFPVGAEAIMNTCGTAPGIYAKLFGADVFVMPGVPREMRTMFEGDVVPAVADKAGGRVILKKVVRTFGAGESRVAEQIVDLMQRDRNPLIGTTASRAIIGIRIIAAGASREEAQALLDGAGAEIRRRLGKLVFGEDEETLSDAAAKMLTAQGKTVSTAESCTGGLIAKRLTDVSGSSAYFLNGVVTYSNEAKQRLLEVPADLLAAHGAVSGPVAEAMAANCRRMSGADFALSVTGIAGPTGGTADKPIGLVYIGLAAEDGCNVREYRLGDHLTREQVRDRTAKVAVNLLRLKLRELGGQSA